MTTIRNKIEIHTKVGPAIFVTFKNLSSSGEHFAVIFKNADVFTTPPLVRVHSECITGDLFGSCKCDCGDQLKESIERFSKSGGILIYLRQEGRGIGLYNKLDAYNLQETGIDTFQANTMLNLPEDMRCFDVAAQMLEAMNIKSIDLLTNNPDKYQQLVDAGIRIRNRISTGSYINKNNKSYIKAKIEKANHTFLQTI